MIKGNCSILRVQYLDAPVTYLTITYRLVKLSVSNLTCELEKKWKTQRVSKRPKN